MQIVIDIPEKIYIHLHDGGSIGASLMIENAIKNGTPLPKGHGKLIDTSQEVEVQLYDDEHEEFTEQMMTIEEYLNRYTNGADTIIEADKEDDAE